MRSAIRLMLKDDPDIEVIGEARDGQTALQMIETLNPNVITMDVEMPGMDGLTATRLIMERFPRPIIMVSSLTERGAETTLKALEAGAVDFISKKSSFVQLDIVKIGAELHEKVRFWGERHLQVATGRLLSKSARPVAVRHQLQGNFRPEVVVIGASTGGPAILPVMLRAMGSLNCPVVIAQHMPLLFTEGFAKHLRSFTGLNVLQASDGMNLTAGMVAVCPGGSNTILREPLPGRLMTCIKSDPGTPIYPSVDKLFESAARLDRKVAAVIMTGMGSDGTAGCSMLFDRDCPVLAQEPEECAVDGMPSSALERGVVDEVLCAEGIARRLRKWAAANV